MLAMTILLALGQPIGEARNLVSRAGSMLETMPQGELVSWFAYQVKANTSK
jgi:hypothetical protein